MSPATPTQARPAADQDTRERIVEASTHLFAERGFRKVTVREICAASQANVAAVNYHFGDKAGLYREVVKRAIRAMRETNDLSQQAGAGTSPEDQLRAFIRVFVERVTGGGRYAWVSKLMARETEDPSEGLDLVMRHVIQPRLEYLGAIIATISGLPADDPRVQRAVVSVQVQFLMLARPLPAPLRRAFSAYTDDPRKTSEHIAAFCLAGIRALPDIQR